MLIIYRTATGEVVENTGTNSYLLEGPPEAAAWGDRDRTGLALLRLHDERDAELVAATSTHRVLVRDGRLTIGEPLPALEAPEVLPAPTGQWASAADARIAALSAAVSALMGTVTLPDPDDEVLGELEPVQGLPDLPDTSDLDDILSELEGL